VSHPHLDDEQPLRAGGLRGHPPQHESKQGEIHQDQTPRNCIHRPSKPQSSVSPPKLTYLLYRLEQELTYYSVLHKGDTISITYSGREYLIDITECKPDDQVCCVEADIEVDFDTPLDYVEPKQPAMRPSKSTVERDEAKKD
jgi:hypothetical protein